MTKSPLPVPRKKPSDGITWQIKLLNEEEAHGFRQANTTAHSDTPNGAHTCECPNEPFFCTNPDHYPRTITTGEITGWRFWRLNHWRVAHLLASINSKNTLWMPHEPMIGTPNLVSCARGPRGIHAFNNKRRAMLEGQLYRYFGVVVIGAIKMWGEVYEFEKGYRAEFAKVASIDAVLDSFPSRCGGDHEVASLLRSLQSIYGVGGTDD